MPTGAVSLSEDVWAAKLAHVLAQGVRSGDVRAAHARRIIVHDLRRGNVNEKLSIHPRSVGAQASIDKYAPDRPPQNSSTDALHADHYGTITKEQVAMIASVEEWLGELARMRQSIVCVTAAENYALTKWELKGVTSPEKYEMAGVHFVDRVPWA